MHPGESSKITAALTEIQKYSHMLFEPIEVEGMEAHGPLLVVSREVLAGFRLLEIYIKHALAQGDFTPLDENSLSKMGDIYEVMSLYQWGFPLYDGNATYQLNTKHLRELISFGAYCQHCKGTQISAEEQNVPKGINLEGESFSVLADEVFKTAIVENLGDLLCFYLYDGKLSEFAELHRLIGSAVQVNWLPSTEMVKHYSELLDEIMQIVSNGDKKLEGQVVKHWKITQVLHAAMSKMSDDERKIVKKQLAAVIKPFKKLVKKFDNRQQELMYSEIIGFERSLDISSELAGTNTGMWAQVAIQGADKFGTRVNLANHAAGVFGLGTFGFLGGLATALSTNRVGWVAPGPILMFFSGYESICTNESHDRATTLLHLNPYRPNAEAIRTLASSSFKNDTLANKLSQESIEEFQRISLRLSKLEQVISDPSTVIATQNSQGLDL